ncbi:transcriptional regulator, AraC family with amidase-like domain [Burkholderia sp. OK233]|nr:transcriptional regulator, AraC family with amidase-like domain [Burkholderia sp. OK233]
MKIVILGFEGSPPSGMLGLVDLFWLAVQAANRTAPPASGCANTAAPQSWEVLTASVDGKSLIDGQGRKLPVDVALHEVERCDAVLIPGIVSGEDALPPCSAPMRKVGAWLREQHAHGALVGASCAGVFVLGEAGLLSGRRCTTTWWLHEELQRRYPDANAVWGSALVDTDRVVSTGGPLSWIDLALHVIRKLVGPEAARIAADFAVVDSTPLQQALYAPRGFLNSRDPFLLDAEQAVRSTSNVMTARTLAVKLATSERTLHRRLKALINESPKAFITRIRFETACVLLEGKTASIKRVAQQSGYEDESSFRRAFVRYAGMSPSSYRVWVRQR